MVIKTQDGNGFAVLGESDEVYIYDRDVWEPGGTKHKFEIYFSRGANDEFWLGSYDSAETAFYVLEDIIGGYLARDGIYRMPAEEESE